MNAGPKLESAADTDAANGESEKEISKGKSTAAEEEDSAYLWTDERKTLVMKRLAAMGKANAEELSFAVLAPGLEECLQCVRFPLMSSSYLYQVVEQEPFVKQLESMRDLMYEAYRYHAVGDRMAAFSQPELAATVLGEGKVEGDDDEESEDEAMARAVAEAASGGGSGESNSAGAIGAAAGEAGAKNMITTVAPAASTASGTEERDADQAWHETSHSGDCNAGKGVRQEPVPTAEQQRQCVCSAI